MNKDRCRECNTKLIGKNAIDVGYCLDCYIRMMADDDYDDDENEITDCPNCGRTYDDADQDFYICHHCGYDANKKTIDRRHISMDRSRVGIDPDARLDDWS